MPSTPFTCCSTGVATILAMVDALAPGYTALTTTVGGVIDGYCSMGRPRNVTHPAITISIDKTVANIGRLMKKVLIIMVSNLAALPQNLVFNI